MLESIAITKWCEESCGMLKHPPPGRVTARKGSDVFSNWTYIE